MNDGSREKPAEYHSEPRGYRLGFKRALGAAVVVAALGLAWRVQRAVRDTMSPATPSAAAALPRWTPTNLRHARRFTVQYRNDSKIVRVMEPSESAGAVQYQLVPRGHRAAPIDNKTIVVEIPVRRVIVLSTTFVTAFTRLGVPDTLVGMAGVKLLNTPELIEQARRGKLVEVGDGNPTMDLNLDFERIRALSPDLIVSSYLGSAGNKLREAGLTVIEDSEWLEQSPLGRAEWIKFMAAFLDLEATAERWFTDLEQRYGAVAALSRHAATRPTVLCGMDHRGTWFMPGGDSYLANLIADAGGDYLWRGEKRTDSLPLKLEAVLTRAQHADVWLLHMSAIHSRREILETDTRYALFDAYRSGRIYNSDAIMSPGGGNDYWENGVANPDRVLADLTAIIHPELAPDHELHWYHRVPAEVHP